MYKIVYVYGVLKQIISILKDTLICIYIVLCSADLLKEQREGNTYQDPRIFRLFSLIRYHPSQ